MISSILVASAMRATPPSARMSAGTRSRAITAHAPASSAILACSAVVTSMMTPPDDHPSVAEDVGPAGAGEGHLRRRIAGRVDDLAGVDLDHLDDDVRRGDLVTRLEHMGFIAVGAKPCAVPLRPGPIHVRGPREAQMDAADLAGTRRRALRERGDRRRDRVPSVPDRVEALRRGVE